MQGITQPDLLEFNDKSAHNTSKVQRDPVSSEKGT